MTITNSPRRDDLDSPVLKAVWSALDALRQGRDHPQLPPELKPLLGERIDEALLAKILEALSLTLSSSELAGLQRMLPSGTFPPARGLAELLRYWLAERPCSRAFDPFAWTGGTLACVLEMLPNASAVACTYRRDDEALGRRLAVSERIEWAGSPREQLPDVSGVDLLISGPPMGMQPSVEVSGRQGKFDEATSTIIRAVRLLNPKCGLLLVVPSGAVIQRTPRALVPSLAEEGWWVDSVIGLPKGALLPSTMISVSLVSFSPVKAHEVFVAELESSEAAGAVVKNWLARQGAKVTSLGRMIPREELATPAMISARERATSVGRRTGGVPLELRLIAKITPFSRRIEGGFELVDNAVYCPEVGPSPAVTDPDRARVVRERLIQLQLDPAIARAEFVAGLLNTEYGRALRDACAVGSAILRVDRKRLAESDLFLPPIEVQEQVLLLQRDIAELRSELGEVERDLWRYPKKVPELRRRVDNVNHEPSLESWMQQLPFPLASILWIYHAKRDEDARVDQLLFFFEAASQFFTTLLLSAVTSERGYFEEHRSELIGADFRADALRRPTFGTWVRLGQQLSAAIRRTRSAGADNAALVQAMFRTESRGVVDMLLNPALFSVFHSVSHWRNDWKGHGGVRSAAMLRDQLGRLQGKLELLRELLSEGFGQYILVRTGAAQYDGDLHHVDCDLLMGRDAIFRQIEVESIEPVVAKRLYLVDADKRRPLALLPFFRMMAPPTVSDNACYFFNRLESGGERWVSYHFEQQGEVTVREQSLEQVISRLVPGE